MNYKRINILIRIILLQKCPQKTCRSNGSREMLWKKLNLRGCFPILQEMYNIRLVKGNAFLAIEIGMTITLLVEIASMATSLAFIGQITRALKKELYFGVPTG